LNKTYIELNSLKKAAINAAFFIGSGIKNDFLRIFYMNSAFFCRNNNLFMKVFAYIAFLTAWEYA